jgi:hypothetical protein
MGMTPDHQSAQQFDSVTCGGANRPQTVSRSYVLEHAVLAATNGCMQTPARGAPTQPREIVRGQQASCSFTVTNSTNLTMSVTVPAAGS